MHSKYEQHKNKNSNEMFYSLIIIIYALFVQLPLHVFPNLSWIQWILILYFIAAGEVEQIYKNLKNMKLLVNVILKFEFNG